MTAKNSILVLGAGELGLAVLRGLTRKLPQTNITVLLRPQTASLPRDSPKLAPIYNLSVPISFLSCDLLASSQSDLAETFKGFDVIIGCTGYDNNSAGIGQGLQMKLANAVLEAETVQLYFPWQFGLDYDQFRVGDAGGLFDEQKQVRSLLRDAVDTGRTKTAWVIVSSGVFMSYLFQPFWGIVLKDEQNGGWIVNALRSWDNSTTVTTSEDIGKLTAEILSVALSHDAEGHSIKNQAVFIAGDTVTYSQLVDIVQDITGQPARRGEVLDYGRVTREMEENPENIIMKY